MNFDDVIIYWLIVVGSGCSIGLVLAVMKWTGLI
jgi:hypothetical protein